MSEVVVTPVIESTPAPVVREEVVSTPMVSVQSNEIPSQKESQTSSEVDSKEEPRLGKKFAELTKRQRELLDKERSIKEMESKLSPIQKALEESKVNPLKLLEAAGISYEQLTDYILSEGDNDSTPTQSSVEQKLKEIEDRILEKERLEREELDRKEQARLQSQIEQFKENIKDYSLNNNYELVNSLEQFDLVYDVILEHHEETGQVLELEKALSLTEQYLQAQAEKILKAKKIVPTQARVESPKQESTFTLSSRTTPPQAASATTERLTPEAARERAIAMLRFK